MHFIIRGRRAPSLILSVGRLLLILNERFKVLYLVPLEGIMWIEDSIMRMYRRLLFRLSIIEPIVVFLAGLAILMVLSIALDLPFGEFVF